MAAVHTVLGLLNVQPMTGYEIKKSIEENGMRFLWSLSYASIYPALKTAEENNWAKMKPEYEGRANLRKVYYITEAGRDELLRWTETEVPSATINDELLLRILFAPAGELRTLESHIRKRMDWLQSSLKEISSYSGPDKYHSLLFKYGVDLFKTQLDFLSDVLKSISTREDTQ